MCRRAAAFQFRRAFLPLYFLGALTWGGCNERAPDLREWRVSDHDRPEGPPANQGQVDPTKPTGPQVAGLEDVTIVAWSQNCTQCHGQLGRGDGPRGPMVKATNLSDAAWQASVTDEQIASAIKLGRGAMPSFKQLPDVTIANLVKLVRMMSVARLQAPPAGSGSAAVPASAAPAGSGAPAVRPKTSSPSPSSSSKPTPKPSGN